ncbi:hypothetical protein CFBP1159_21850 [Xanthomonas arboricola pv. corylina]|uniref:Uncharacterized protein n=1 Tax=Xanthomonas arboricola pv. corylina TaxID=487821 RepID=A0A8D6V3G5_9XANT|nr:hypothetical protein CFBP1159_21850 [Xanthomonas arboricola pv. corylina]CAE6771934.1 hypothetical protein CFBP1159_21850 [Xanthomonas arboricola pv. corylina]
MTCSSVKRFFTSNLLGGRELDSKLGCYSKSGGRRIYDIAHGEIRAFDAEKGGFRPLLADNTPEATPRPRLQQVVRAELA